jgi:hypothetical protein
LKACSLDLGVEGAEFGERQVADATARMAEILRSSQLSAVSYQQS